MSQYTASKVVPSFGAARNKNTQYQNVYGAHRFTDHPSHEERAANHAVVARQSYSTPQIRTTWEENDRWTMQGKINEYTGKQGFPDKKMVKLHGMDDFASRRKKDPYSEALDGPVIKMKSIRAKEYDYFNKTAGYATLGVGVLGLLFLFI